MNYLLVGVAFLAILFFVLYLRSRQDNKDAQNDLQNLRSELKSAEQLQSKTKTELSKVEKDLLSANQLRKRTEDNLSGLETELHRKTEAAFLLEKQNKSMEKRFQEVSSSIKELSAENDSLRRKLTRHERNLEKLLQSNLTAIPWLAGMMADYMTFDIEIEATKLNWGHNIQREKKVASIRAIRAAAKERIEEAKVASYQLSYLLTLYPALSDIIETDFSDLQLTNDIPEYDPVRDWLSREEWNSLSEDARNQLALDRYIQSRNKSKWQIGRDYELSVAHELMADGFSVENTGSYLRLEDMGRDIIAHKNGKTYILQCKYWSEQKVIHEKHIYQLYGTAISYSIESAKATSNIVPVFVTNICLSEVARKAASMLNVLVYENHPMKEFPRIKCNIGRDEYGQTKIYHLPMDAQYDNTIIKNPGEFYAYTVSEATQHGFRRAFKWHGE